MVLAVSGDATFSPNLRLRVLYSGAGPSFADEIWVMNHAIFGTFDM